MRILQIVLPDSTAYERKSQRVDQAALSPSHEVFTISDPSQFPPADVAHVYAPPHLMGRRLRRLSIPWLTNGTLTRSPLPWLRGRPPASVISPLPGIGVSVVPEATEDRYFDEPSAGTMSSDLERPRVVGSFVRPALRGLVEQTLGRLHRFRDDVSWHLFDGDPSPEDLDGLDAWVDPAVDPLDLDGFGAEAIVRGLPVVAARTPINTVRLENGRTGWLVPAGDPNELTHAILSVLFKSELGQNKISAAKQTRAKFRSRQRLRVLIPLYEALRP